MVSDWFWPCFVVCRPPFFPLKRASPRGSGLESLSLVRRPLAYYVSWDARTLKAVLPSGPCRHVDMRIMFGHGDIWILRHGWLEIYLVLLENSFARPRFRSRMSTFILSCCCIPQTYTYVHISRMALRSWSTSSSGNTDRKQPLQRPRIYHTPRRTYVREGPNHHPLLSVISGSGSGSLFSAHNEFRGSQEGL